MSNDIALSIATVPDVEALRRIHQLGDLSDEGVLNASMHLHNQQHGSRTLPLYQQQIISVAIVRSSAVTGLSLHCLDISQQDELALLKQLNELIGTNATLVAWEMNSHSLPLLNYRLLKHSLIAPCVNEAETVDLRQMLSNADASAAADFAGLASSLHLPAMPEINQQWVIDCYLAQDLGKVHQANQLHALNSYLIHLRYQLIKAKLSTQEYQSICESLRQALIASDITAFKQFEADWVAA